MNIKQLNEKLEKILNESQNHNIAILYLDTLKLNLEPLEKTNIWFPQSFIQNISVPIKKSIPLANNIEEIFKAISEVMEKKHWEDTHEFSPIHYDVQNGQLILDYGKLDFNLYGHDGERATSWYLTSSENEENTVNVTGKIDVTIRIQKPLESIEELASYKI